MKKNTKFAFMAIVGLACMSFFTACGGNEEMTKKIPAEAVSIQGEHANLLEIADSVKVLLTNPSGKKKSWEVQLIIPMKNTTSWSKVDGTNENASTYYTASMGNLHVAYTNSNEVDLDYEVTPDWDAIKTILKSETITERNVSVEPAFKFLTSLTYKEAKSIYEKIAGVHITNAELSKVYSSSSSSSSSSSYDDDDDDDDDLDDDIDKAIEMNKKAMKAAQKAAKAANSKDVNDAIDAYNDALDAYSNMLK